MREGRGQRGGARAGWAHVVRLDVIARVVERRDQQPVVQALVGAARAWFVLPISDRHAEQVRLLGPGPGRECLRHDEAHQHVGHLPIVRAQPLALGDILDLMALDQFAEADAVEKAVAIVIGSASLFDRAETKRSTHLRVGAMIS